MVSRALIAGLILASGCNQIFGLEAPAGDDDVPTDGTDSATWGPARKLDVATLPGVLEEDPAITPDGLQLFFAVTATMGTKDLWVSSRTSVDSAWLTPVLSDLSSTTSIEGSPRFDQGPGVLEVYFASDRLGGALDIFRATRDAGQAFDTPARVVELSAVEEDSTASPCLDGTRFVVASTRGGASSDLFEVDAGVVTAIAAVNTASAETGPFVTEDCLHLYYASSNRGTFDLYVARRASIAEPWGAPAMITSLSTSFQEGDPWVSPDGRQILYTSDAGGDLDLFEARR